jgi:arylsulfatase A-like enzyme
MSHELSLYDTLLHVPLMIRFPQRMQSPSVQEKPVQLIDIFPTLLQVLHIKPEGLGLQGANLLPDEMSKRLDNFVFAEYNNSRAVDNIERKFGKAVPPNPVYLRKILKVARSDKWKFIWGTDGTRELYAINKDPYETNNLFQSNQDEAKQMELALKAWVSSFTPSHYYRQEEISPEARQELRSLGYIQ